MALVEPEYEYRRTDRWSPAGELDELAEPTDLTGTVAAWRPAQGIGPHSGRRILSEDDDIAAFADWVIVVSSDPDTEHADAISTQYAERRALENAYRSRIRLLAHAAIHEGFSLNPASEAGFWAFLATQPPLKKGHLILVDNGNLRLSWDNGRGDHVALQFLGGDEVQFVVFARGKEGRRPTRLYGRCPIHEIRHQITDPSVREIFYA